MDAKKLQTAAATVRAALADPDATALLDHLPPVAQLETRLAVVKAHATLLTDLVQLARRAARTRAAVNALDLCKPLRDVLGDSPQGLKVVTALAAEQIVTVGDILTVSAETLHRTRYVGVRGWGLLCDRLKPLGVDLQAA